MAELKDIAVGQKVRFKGYTDAVDDPLLTAGEIVQIRAINPDGGLIIDMLDAEGNVRSDVEETDTLFPEEIELIVADDLVADEVEASQVDPAVEENDGVDVPAEAAEEAPAEAKAPAKGKSKGKAQSGPKGKTKPGRKAKEDVVEKAPTEGRAAELVSDTNPAEELDDAGPRSELVRNAIASVTAAGEDMGDGQAALMAAKSLVNQVDETYYTLGGVLSYIKETGVYKALGFDGKRGFADYCKAELGTDYRKAAYLIDVYEKVQAAGLNETRLREIGWSKAIQIVRVGDVSMEKLAEDFDDLVDFAKTHSRDDLISHIQQGYEVARRSGNTNTEQVNTSTFLFKLQSEQAASAERALQTAKGLAETEDLSLAFAYICDDWSLMTEGTTLDIETAMSVIEARFGVVLSATDAEGNAVARAQTSEEVSEEQTEEEATA